MARLDLTDQTRLDHLDGGTPAAHTVFPSRSGLNEHDQRMLYHDIAAAIIMRCTQGAEATAHYIKRDRLEEYLDGIA